jgi:hypothetical protein
VAKGAGVPIVPVAFDFPAKTIRIFAPLAPGEDIDADIARLSAHYDARMARHPALY